MAMKVLTVKIKRKKINGVIMRTQIKIKIQNKINMNKVINGF